MISKLFFLILTNFFIILSQAYPHVIPKSITDESKNPVILIPGIGGSQLWAKLDKPETNHLFCDLKTNDYFNIWLDLEQILPFAIDCWSDNVILTYNSKNKTTSNAPGVDIRVLDFGNTTAIEYIDASKLELTVYFNKIVEKLLSVGYKKKVNLFGAPYDFRKSPNELEFFKDLNILIENAYKNNNQKSCHIVCHSMGCLYFYSFLKSKDQKWKDKYIKNFITLGAPWGGSVKAVKSIVSGDNLGLGLVSDLYMRHLSRTFPTTLLLFPRKDVWFENEVLVSWETKQNTNVTYTISELDKLFKDLNYNDGIEMYNSLKNFVTDLNPPNVETYCLYGLGIDTVEKLHFLETRFPNISPTMEMGDGDGTVNRRSLEICRNWMGEQDQIVNYKYFKNTEHFETVSSSDVVDEIFKIINLKKDL